MSEQPDAFALSDPRLAAYSWFRDGLHVPRPIPALVADAQAIWTQVAMGGRVEVVNGYLYMSMGAPSDTPAHRVQPAPQRDAMAAWQEFYLPRVKAVCRRSRESDWDALDARALADALPEAMRDAGIGFSYTMAPLMAITGPVTMLMSFCERYFGVGSDVRALTMLQGHANETAAAGAGLAQLAELASGSPEVAAAIRLGNLASIDSLEGGPAFREAFARYLDEYGQSTQTWFEFHRPTWSEDAGAPLAAIAAMLDRPGATREAHARAADGRERAIAAAMAALPGEGERQQLRGILTATEGYVAIIEDRARWQMTLAASQRWPALALGRKLAAQGKLAASDDVFLFHVSELQQAAEHAATDLRLLAAERRTALGRWAKLVPPETLGAPLPPGIEGNLMFGKMFGVGRPNAPAEEGVILGLPASGGRVRGVARVILDLDDGDRFADGEVLVCPFTAPPWTPLFAVAAAVVTDAGGVLSHAAIEAREYAIPAVVGAKDGTRRIPDGALVEVDGDAGTITILAEGRK